jgi:hypothetical protein
MTEDALARCSRRLPPLFAEAIERLRARARSGAREAVALLRDREGGTVACRLRLEGEGEGEGYLVVRAGALAIERAAPGVPVRYALRMSSSAVRRGFDWLDAGELDGTRLGEALLALASREAEKLFLRYPCSFAAVVADVPGLGEFAFSASLGGDALPDTPQFSVHVAWAELVEARARGEGVQELILSGRARLSGDSARAMMLAMTLAQLR